MGTELIKLESDGNICILSLNRGITNAINLPLINEISTNLLKLREDKEIQGVVLTSSNTKFFAIGFDIPEFLNLHQEEFTKFYTAFNKLCLDLYTFPKPLVAALTGHTTAGGCILALCCDYRFIAEGRKFMGLNEIKLGVPVPYVGDCVLTQLVGYNKAREITDFGEFYLPEQLLKFGMVDEVFPIDDLLKKAIEKAKKLGFAPEAFSIIKKNRVEKIENKILKSLSAKEKAFIQLWYSPECRKLIQKAAKKF